MQQTPPATLIPLDAISGGMVYLSSVEDIYSPQCPLAYMRIIERAWHNFELTGVLCVDGIPSVYFREISSPLSEAELNDLHRSFWNQGVAQTLVVADPQTVRIFSGLAKPQKTEASLSENSALVDTLKRLEFVQIVHSFFQASANGKWYADNSSYYTTESSVDAYLLDNLVALRNQLTAGESSLSSSMAHAFIGRILFVCYLVDRGIYSLPSELKESTLTEALNNRSGKDAIAFLYELFAKLKSEFNGSMFDQDLPFEKSHVTFAHIKTLRLFLGGHDVCAKQHTLGFWAYDFKLIPVETISAIYEEFLAHEDLNGKRKDGAFYTPRFLAEMTLDVALEGTSAWESRRYLDPCCGSGIFLVTLFNRLATKWLLDNPDCDSDPESYRRKAQALIDILTNNIRGVDINLTACRLACFSLYVAFLDYLSPKDIQTFVLETGHKLPRLLAENETSKSSHCIPVVRQADFLNNNGLEEKSFDYIIGNPPWEGRGKKQIAIHILECADQYLIDGGEGCLLLPSKIFLNSKTNQFQSRWLKQVTLDRVIQLADYRKILFEQAKCPSMIVRYRKRAIKDISHQIAYDTPKFTLTSRRRGLVTVESAEHKWLPQVQLMDAAVNNNAPVVWKRSLWGTGRDQRLLNYFETMPNLGDQVDVLSELRRRKTARTKPWAVGQGLKPYAGTDEGSDRALVPMPWSLATLFVTPADMTSTTIVSPECLDSLGTHLRSKGKRLDVLYSSPPKEIFTPPFILVNQGFTNAVFCGHEAVFQNSLNSISGPREDEDLLLFLAAFLRSKLAKYIMFHTAANWGTERDKVHLEELLKIPFPLRGDAPSSDAQKIVETVAMHMRNEAQAEQELLVDCRETCCGIAGIDEKASFKRWNDLRKRRVKILQATFDPLIYEYFGLLEPEISLITDTVNVFIPSSTPPNSECIDLPTLQPVVSATVPGYEQGLARYAETLTSTLNSWAKERNSDFRVSPTVGIDNASGVAMVTLSLGLNAMTVSTRELEGELSGWLKRGLSASSKGRHTISSERELLWFEGDKVHIVRPWTLIHWTCTSALNDADRIFGEISRARRDVRA